jgi:hypothetical protein
MVRDDIMAPSVKQVDFADFITNKLDDMKVDASVGW